MALDNNLDRKIQRFLEEARQGLENLGKDRKTMLQEIPRFFEGARQGLRVLRPAVAELDLHLARRFSTFEYIDLDENCMSDVLADLLRPDSAHGQGDLFLSAFLKHLRNHEATKKGMERILPDDSTWLDARVFREALTLHIKDWNRRIDIEINLQVNGRPVGIGIENKPSAEDQPAQLADYAEHLKGKYGDRYLLLYLTPGGKPPTEGSLSKDQKDELGDHFACASLEKWARGWIKEAESQVKAIYVQRFVADFRQVLLKRHANSESEPYSSMLT